ncbi:MAG: nitroreductase family protein [Acidimicrobiales bacterium]
MSAGEAVDPTLATIWSRRSVRFGFADRPLPSEVVDQIVAAGLAAPSSKDAKPWRLHVVTDRDLLQSIGAAARRAPGIEDYVPHDPASGEPRPEYHSTVIESCETLEAVPLAIFVENRGVFSSGRDALLGATTEHRAAALMGYGLELMGLGAAIENMWLAAVALGLGGVLLGDVLIAEDAIVEALGIEGDVVGVLALGPVAEPPAVRIPAVHDDPRVVWRPARP